MSSPVRVFDGTGACMDGRQRRGLPAIDLLRTPFRALFFKRPGAGVAWVWLLDDDATFVGFSHRVVAAAISMTMNDQSVLILGNNFESVRNVLAGLKAAKVSGVGSAERHGRRIEEGAWARRMAKVMA